jgi:hypothetical protein
MSRTDPTVRCFVTGTLFLLGSTARAHDLWLVPAEEAAVGKPAVVRANSGSDFPNSEHAPDPAAFARRVVVRPDGTAGALEAAGREDQSGLLRFDPDRPGVYVVAVETRPKLLTLAAVAFNDCADRTARRF